MENRKPFTTFDVQIDILKDRGLRIDDVDRDKAKRLLMCEGYYAVVNSYKDIFIDEVSTRAVGMTDTAMGRPSTIFRLCSASIGSCGALRFPR